MSLAHKEKIVLGEIVRHYIGHPVPVSSSLISQNSRINMSPATIRNVMSSLEKKGYIYQPHTSAGRVPKTLGYRGYVDSLMKKARLSADEKGQIAGSIAQIDHKLDEVLKEVTRILAHLSRQLGIILTPLIDRGIFERMELIPLSSERLLVVMTIDSGFVKTITMELSSLIAGEKLHLVSQILNERLHGMKIADIRRKFADIVKDIRSEETGLVRIFSQRADRLFDFGEDNELYFMGTHNIVRKPDFSDVSAVSSVVELLESRKIFLGLLDQPSAAEGATIKIGEEIKEQRMQECSMITARYRVGSIDGILGIIGPKRMNYGKLVALVEFTATKISDVHGRN